MPRTPVSVPVVLCLSGHDPIGGAGIQADIETLAALGCHAATAVTCLTVQDTRDVTRLVPTPVELLAAQIAAVRGDLRLAAVKVGLVGDAALARLIADLAGDLAVPLVLDPVLAAGGGRDLGDGAIERAVAGLSSLARLATPNRAEARRLTGRPDPDAAARALLESGCAAVLLTGADEAAGAEVVNRLYVPDEAPRDFVWPRLPGSFHGSGCTLASACAGLLARGEPLAAAVEAAQVFTWQTLARAHAPGRGQQLPRRIAP